MDLQEFISKSLMSIIDGVSDAQNKAREKGAHINPTNLNMLRQNVAENTLWDADQNNFSQTVRFDVAVTIEKGKSTEGKIGVLSGVVNLGSSGQSENKNTAVNRLQFNVPILLPGSNIKNK